MNSMILFEILAFVALLFSFLLVSRRHHQIINQLPPFFAFFFSFSSLPVSFSVAHLVVFAVYILMNVLGNNSSSIAAVERLPLVVEEKEVVAEQLVVGIVEQVAEIVI